MAVEGANGLQVNFGAALQRMSEENNTRAFRHDAYDCRLL